jgi:GntR family transcriptional repressor for pyruvate dehydrogenase complex
MTREPRWRFHRISGARAHEEIVDQVTFAIRAGLFRPGDQLPRIDELARLTGVSKPTVGQAMKLLADNGVVETRRGVSGGVTVVKDLIPPKILDMAGGPRESSLRELLEARRPIEVELAILAGERADEQDFQMLDEAVSSLEERRNRARSNEAAWTHYDHLFHYLIGRAGRSEVLAHYQHGILEQLAIRMRSYFSKREDPDSVIMLHRETAAALRSRNRDLIIKAIDGHLLPLETYVKEEEEAGQAQRQSGQSEPWEME